MNQETSKNIVYEHPMNERIRNLLRIEHLYNIIDNRLKEDSEYNCRDIIEALLQITDLLLRSDIKNEIIKELKRQYDILDTLRKNSEVDIDRLNMVKKAMEKIVKGLNTKTCLNLWGSDISNTLIEFQEFPVDIIGIDFTSSNIDKFDKIEMKKGLACGLIDAKNTKMEKPSDVIRELKNIKNTFNPESISVISSWDFEFIPESFADKKLQIMKQIKEKSKMMKL